ncbi:DUF4031 domain-containing protein [Paraburkholderia hospita]|uniref:DUF4031 domain-containing protein n=1 Tax=Paraburkholderia hospita TaxID=169430 RepID=UPI000B347CB8|nr:DUF4031 domain-containing protein [Paraburkholderia hospita]OUL72165.1 hypothetical protein CA603_46255 [Paraburkholderia hospita]
MAIYVDDEQIPWRGKLWCHLVADSLAELHEFAQRLGLRRAWFQERSVYPHYDVTLSVRDKALAMGAAMGDRTTIIVCAKQLKAELYESKDPVPQS